MCVLMAHLSRHLVVQPLQRAGHTSQHCRHHLDLLQRRVLHRYAAATVVRGAQLGATGATMAPRRAERCLRAGLCVNDDRRRVVR